ncbi:hypothetical protein [Hymenobacter convexus]|uniref:hypothetical protein n=1 Tax=Hymenobacter sp. CA1UV-4 TaxID=3063782 RepID=UPI0027133BAC|nr:hypothetical protein [Hymenobacter sp. CA1UV-4]MDO7853167.1 hypothetical protein [Hymenobacter sp. CA1UV-4]
MPLVLSAPPFIDRAIRPLRIGPLVFQRVQRYLTHYPVQDPLTGNVEVFVEVWVLHFFTNADGTAGADAGAVVANYKATYKALNSEIIDVRTQEIVYTRKRETDQEWADLLAGDPRPLAERGNAFGQQMHTLPTVTQAQQLEAAMDAADGPPWYRFGRDEEPAA